MPRRHNRRPLKSRNYTEPNKIPLRELWIRDGGICQWCLRPCDLEDATRDHLIPKSRGGRNGHNFENIALMCQRCNGMKQDYAIERTA